MQKVGQLRNEKFCISVMFKNKQKQFLYMIIFWLTNIFNTLVPI